MIPNRVRPLALPGQTTSKYFSSCSLPDIVSRAASNNALHKLGYMATPRATRGYTSQVLADIVATLKQQFSEKFALDIAKRVEVLLRYDTC